MRKVFSGMIAAAAVVLVTAAPAYATSVKPVMPPVVSPGYIVEPVPLPEVMPGYPVKPSPIKPIPPLTRVESAPILRAVAYSSMMPCTSPASAGRSCAPRTVIKAYSLDERCWIQPRLTVVSATNGALTVKLSGLSVKFSSRDCGNPTRAVVSVSVPSHVTSVIDHSTGNRVDTVQLIAR